MYLYACCVYYSAPDAKDRDLQDLILEWEKPYQLPCRIKSQEGKQTEYAVSYTWFTVKHIFRSFNMFKAMLAADEDPS